MPVSEETYKRVALEDGDETWELHCGRLVAKPAMTLWHNELGIQLAAYLLRLVSRRGYRVRSNAGRARRDEAHYYVPDCIVIPNELAARLRGDELELYSDPLPLVVEVWSPSTGNYDVDEKLPHYEARGDLEIWRLHPFDRTLTRWQRQENGSYEFDVVTGGKVRLHGIPGVTVDLDRLWATLDS